MCVCVRLHDAVYIINETQHKAGWAGPFLDVRKSGTTGNRLWNNVLESSAGKRGGGGFPFFITPSKINVMEFWLILNICAIITTCVGIFFSPPGGPASPAEPLGRSGLAHTGQPCLSPSPGCPGSAPCYSTSTPPHAPPGWHAGEAQSHHEHS